MKQQRPVVGAEAGQKDHTQPQQAGTTSRKNRPLNHVCRNSEQLARQSKEARPNKSESGMRRSMEEAHGLETVHSVGRRQRSGLGEM